MKTYNLIAPAKINLYLEIIGDRADGYHELVMILQSINLADQINLRASSTDSIRVRCNHPQVPTDQTNLAYRAAELMTKEFPQAFSQFGGVDISITKNIPVAAGLAGGSTNAAAVLVGMDLLWNLGLTLVELEELGATLGSDVPFCIAGGTAIATGRGDQLSPLPNLNNLSVVLAKHRSLEVSTPWAYKTYRTQYGNSYITDKKSLAARAGAVHSGPMVKAILQQSGDVIGQKLHNDLEKVVLPTYPQVSELRSLFGEAGVLGVMMSGSGPTVFALCETYTQALQVEFDVKRALNNSDVDFWVTQFCHTGIRVAAS